MDVDSEVDAEVDAEVEVFIDECASSETLMDMCLIDKQLFADIIRDIVVLSRSPNPIDRLKEYFNRDDIEIILKLEEDSNDNSVAYLASVANSCIRMDVEQFEESLLGYIDFLVEESMKDIGSNTVDLDAIIHASLARQIPSILQGNIPVPIINAPRKTLMRETYEQHLISTPSVTPSITPSCLTAVVTSPTKTTTTSREARVAKTETIRQTIRSVETKPSETKVRIPRQPQNTNKDIRHTRSVVIPHVDHVTEIETTPCEVKTKTVTVRRRKPDQNVKKNKQLELISIAAKIASVRSIDTSDTTVRFRSTHSLKESELVKVILSYRHDSEKLDYIESIFPRIDNISPELYDIMSSNMVQYSKSPILRGLSGVILDYEILLKEHMIDNNVGHAAKILAIGQKTSVILDGQQSEQYIKTIRPPTVKYKRKAILHEDVSIVSERTLKTTIKECLKSVQTLQGNTRQTPLKLPPLKQCVGDIIAGFLKDRTRNIIKNLENIKTEDSVSRHNKAITKRSTVFAARNRYDKHICAAHIAKKSYSYVRSHYNVVCDVVHDTVHQRRCVETIDISDIELTYNTYGAVLQDLNDRRHSMDLRGIESTGKLLYHKQYVEFYRGYYKEIESLVSKFNDASVMLENAIDQHLSDLGSRKTKVPRIVKLVVKGNTKSHKINTTAIRVKNTHEGKRYVTLTDEPILDFATSVSRQADLIKYETEGKTNKDILETMSEILLNMSTSRSIDGSELRHLSQLLLNTTHKME